MMVPKERGPDYEKRIFIGLAAFATYAVAKYTRVADELAGTAASNGWFAIYETGFVPGFEKRVSEGGLPLMMGGNDAQAVAYIGAAIREILRRPLYFRGLILSHMVGPLLVILGLLFFAYQVRVTRRKIFEQDALGEEAGSAHFETDFDSYNEKFVDDYDPRWPTPDNNAIMADGIKLSMNTRKTMRNMNFLVIGGSGAGKTRFLVKPIAPIKLKKLKFIALPAYSFA